MHNTTSPNVDKSAFPYALLSRGAHVCAPNIHLFAELDSTNTYLKTQAQNGAPHGTVVIAQTQTKGHGRFERSFYSPRDTGLYMSVLYRRRAIGGRSLSLARTETATHNAKAPDTDDALFASPALFTTTAAVAVCRAIQKIADINPRIKWVNDVYCRGKKVCGILCEALFDENQNMCVVIGIGINITTNDFPNELESKAAAIFAPNDTGARTDSVSVDGKNDGVESNGVCTERECKNGAAQTVRAQQVQEPTETPLRLTLAAHVLNELFFALTEESKEAVMAEYKSRSCVLGKEIQVFAPNETYNARAESITDEGFLTVRRENGTVEVLNSGEISIKPLV